MNKDACPLSDCCRPDSGMVVQMLRTAVLLLDGKTGTLRHSGQEVPYRMQGYRRILVRHSIVQDISRKGNCRANVQIEVFFTVLKTGGIAKVS